MDQEVDDLLYGSFEEPGIVDSVATEEKTAPIISRPETAITDQRMTSQTIQIQEESQQKGQSQGRGLLNPNSSKQGKLFIGGLSWETTDDGLRNYMKVYGEIEDVLIMKDSFTNRSRGFAFLTFTDPSSIDKVLQTDHYIDGKKVPLVINKKIDPKRAVPKEEYERAEKMFVGGVPDISDEEFKEFFGKFGVVTEANVMFDRNTGRPRGFGFVTFANWDGVQSALYAQASKGIFLMGKRMEVKPASLRHRPLGMTYRGIMMPSHMGMPLPGLGEVESNVVPNYAHIPEAGYDRGSLDDTREALKSGRFDHGREDRREDMHRDVNDRYDRDDDRESLKSGRSGRFGHERGDRRGSRHRYRQGRYDRDDAGRKSRDWDDDRYGRNGMHDQRDRRR